MQEATQAPTPVHIAVLTVSSSRTDKDDASGDLLVERLTAAGHRLVARNWVSDHQVSIEDQLKVWSADPSIDVILTTGGTGLTGSDVTPEAVTAVSEKEIPGFGELFRMVSYDIIGTSTMQSRATAGLCTGTYIFALPGSPSACRDAWDGILVHQLNSAHRPCNLVQLLPRLLEPETTPNAA